MPFSAFHDAGMSKTTSIRDVLAVVDGTPSSQSAVDQAVAYAAQNGAILTIVVVTENLALISAADPMAYAQAVEASEALCRTYVQAVRDRVETASIRTEVLSIFDAPGALPGRAQSQGQFADVALVADSTRWQSDALRRHITEALIFAGVPTLIMPPSWSPAPMRHAALGWNASVESLRAARALLAFVEPDAKIDIIVVDALDGYTADKPVPGVDIARHLGRHGHDCNVHAIPPAGHTVAAALQQFAARQGAELLVIGGYGRSRAIEFILGGVTRDLLAQQRLPVVFVH